MRSATLFILAVLALATAAPALAAPRSVNDCEEIKEAMAYNACLASFGPERVRHAGAASGDAAVRGYAQTKAARRSPGLSGAGLVQQRRGGRVHVEFTPRHS